MNIKYYINDLTKFDCNKLIEKINNSSDYKDILIEITNYISVFEERLNNTMRQQSAELYKIQQELALNLSTEINKLLTDINMKIKKVIEE